MYINSNTPVGTTDEEETAFREREVQVQEKDVELRRKGQKWEVLIAIGTAGLPILALFGILGVARR